MSEHRMDPETEAALRRCDWFVRAFYRDLETLLRSNDLPGFIPADHEEIASQLGCHIQVVRNALGVLRRLHLLRKGRQFYYSPLIASEMMEKLRAQKKMPTMPPRSEGTGEKRVSGDRD